VRGLAGVHDVDLDALTHQGEQCGEDLVEGHGRWITANEAFASGGIDRNFHSSSRASAIV
jgi:hypothetical protein